MPREPRLAEPATVPPHVVRRVKIGLAAVAVLGVAVLAFFVVRTLQEESSTERWDLLTALRTQYEPDDDALTEAQPGPVERTVRTKWLEELKRFLDRHAQGGDDALEPHVRFLVYKAEMDLVLALRAAPAEERLPHYDGALEQLRVIRDRFRDWPGNWNELVQQEGEADTISGLVKRVEARRAWDAAHSLKEKAPAEDTVVLVRTSLGDMRYGLYAADAADLVQRFLARAVSGAYDGTAFYAKTEKGNAQDPHRATIRAGDPATRGAKPYDKDQHTAFGKVVPTDFLLPAESRNRIPHVRGTLAMWHPDGENAYDYAGEFLVVTRRSPDLDYAYAPIGKALDEASMAVADRIFATATWEQDRTVADAPSKYGSILKFFQVPVKIEKVLVYEGGTLVKPEGTPDAGKAAADESEASLATVKPDQYKAEPPAPPAPPAKDEKSPPPGEGGDGAPPEKDAPPGEDAPPEKDETPPGSTEEAPR